MRAVALLALIVTASFGKQIQAAADKNACNRACLIGITERYLTAMAAHDIAQAPFAKNVKFTENAATLPLTEGLWYTATGIGDYKLFVADSQMGQVGYIGIVNEHDKPVLVALRLKVVQGQITEAESIVSRTLNERSMPNLVTPRTAFAEKLAAGERRSRAELIRISNLYFDGIEKVTASVVPFDPECNRLENGGRSAGPVTTPNATAELPGAAPGAGPRMQTCVDGFNSGINAIITSITPRRVPIVDEETGVTFGFYMFNHKGLRTYTMRDGTVRNGPNNGQPFSVAMAEVFKIKSGNIRDVEAVGTRVPYKLTFGWE